MPRFAGQSDVEFERGEMEARVSALEQALAGIQKDVRETRESQIRTESALKGALWVTGAFGSVLGAVLTFLTILGFRKP